MTTLRHTRAPRSRCAHPYCPFLTRTEFCPLHHHADPGTPMTTRTERAAPPTTTPRSTRC